MRQFLRLIVVLMLTSALGACVPSVFPLYKDKDLRFDPALIGAWAEKPDDTGTWTFTQADQMSYSLVVKDGDKQGAFEVHLLQLGKYRFLDIAPAEQSLDQALLPDIYKAGLIPGHMFIKVVQIAPVLQMAMLDPDWLGKRLDANPKELAHRGRAHGHGEHDIVLLAPTSELQAFMLKHADDPHAFGDPSDFKRLK